MAIIDCVTFNGEHDIWDIHYNVLKHSVDEFIVVEFDKTFSGKDKEPTFNYEKYPDVTYRFLTEEWYGKYKELAESSPNTKGAEHWKREFMQKESVKDALTHLKDDDIVFIGDVDEVWNPEHLIYLTCGQEVEKMKLAVYTYYLNNRSDEQFWGTIFGKYKNIKGECLNHLRTNAEKTKGRYGWHFTNVMSLGKIRDKLNASYTAESYNTPEVQALLEHRYKNNIDYMGRSFQFRVDESELPKWLLDHKNDYKHLFR